MTMKVGDIIESASQAASLILAELPREETEERLYVIPLSGSGSILSRPILVSVGVRDGETTVEAGAIFREALKVGAEEIIVGHNHPSGRLNPSREDVEATRELSDLAERLNVKFLDHLIVARLKDGSANFVSLMELLD